MKIGKFILLSLFIVILTNSCIKHREVRTMEQGTAELKKYLKKFKITQKPTLLGLYYIEQEKGSGEKIVAGDTVEVKYEGSLTDGTVFMSSEEAKRPYKFVVGKHDETDLSYTALSGIEQGVSLMNLNGKARLIIPYSLAYGDVQQGDLVPAYSPIVVDIEVVSLKKGRRPQRYDLSGFDIQQAPGDVIYRKIKENPEGTEIKKGSKLELEITGYLADNYVFFSTVVINKKINVTIGAGQLVEGVENVLKELRYGEKCSMEVPPKVGYGDRGYMPFIPPKATLYYDIEIMQEI